MGQRSYKYEDLVNLEDKVNIEIGMIVTEGGSLSKLRYLLKTVDWIKSEKVKHEKTAPEEDKPLHNEGQIH